MENFSTYDRLKEANPHLPDEQVREFAENYLYEEYKFRDWVIVVENYCGNKELWGYAVKEKVFLKNKVDEDGHLEGILRFHPDDGYIKDINIYDKNQVVRYLAEQTIFKAIEEDWKRKGSKDWEWYDWSILKKIDFPDQFEVYKYPISKKTKRTNQRGILHRAWSLMVRTRDKKCVKCGGVENLHAHHVNSYKDYEELRYDVNNGVTYCEDCHREWHKENGR